MAACPALLDRSMHTIHEQPQSLCEYAGKVVPVVNTASQCGYTPQYEGLEALYRKYRTRGLVVLGFPTNDFGGQEPGSNKVPMFAKTELKRNPLYADLVKATGAAPRWNFHKYLVDRSGKQVVSFDTRIEPNDPRLLSRYFAVCLSRKALPRATAALSASSGVLRPCQADSSS